MQFGVKINSVYWANTTPGTQLFWNKISKLLLLKLGKIIWFYLCYRGESVWVEFAVQVHSWGLSEGVPVCAFGTSCCAMLYNHTAFWTIVSNLKWNLQLSGFKEGLKFRSFVLVTSVGFADGQRCVHWRSVCKSSNKQNSIKCRCE